MSTDDVDTVRKVAALARLKVAPDEELRLAQQFGRILAAFHELAELDVAGAPEMAAPVRGAAVLRADEARASLPRERLLGGAPEREGEFYRVPKTVGGIEG
jgi:aspartyl-tRNA(Asn)/glutamyl-tRNA(Gln) amidotransferase subunit C